MSDKTIKHFVFTRFFPKQDPKYPYDVLDVDFLSKQLTLAQNNELKSLENQTNKNFELVFLANPKFFDDPKYKFVFSTLQNSTTLPITFTTMADMRNLVKDAYEKYDFVIQSRMDFDDFIYKDAIADTQSKVNECDSVLIYGYNKGYVYVQGELYPEYFSKNVTGHQSILQSLIWKSSFAKKMPFISIYGSNHWETKFRIKNFLEENGFKFSESMLQQNKSANTYIYFRSEFSHYILTHNEGKALIKAPNRPKITCDDITKKQLEEEFGFCLKLNSIK